MAITNAESKAAKGRRVTEITRYVSVDMRTLARIVRHKRGKDATGQIAIKQPRVSWAISRDATPDRFVEYRTFERALKSFAQRARLAAVAGAWPSRFADMIAHAYDLGVIVRSGTPAMDLLESLLANPARFAAVRVTSRTIGFTTMRGPGLPGAHADVPTLTVISFSLRRQIVKQRAFALG